MKKTTTRKAAGAAKNKATGRSAERAGKAPGAVPMEQTKAYRDLEKLRRKIDAADQVVLKALARRFLVIDAVGRLKARHGLPVVQKQRWEQALGDRLDLAKWLGLDRGFVKSMFDMIQDESIAVQKRIAKSVGKGTKGKA